MDEQFVVEIILKAIDQASGPIRNLNRAVDELRAKAAADDATGDLSQGFQDIGDAAEDAERDVRSHRDELERHGSAARSHARNVQESSKALDDHASSAERARQPVKALSDESDKASRAAEQQAQRVRELTAEYENWSKAARDVGLSNSESARGLSQISREAESLARSLPRASQAWRDMAHIATEAGRAARQAGVADEAERLTQAYRNFDQMARAGQVTASAAKDSYRDFATSFDRLRDSIEKGSSAWRQYGRFIDDATHKAARAKITVAGGGNLFSGFFGNLTSGEGLQGVDRAFQNLSAHADSFGVKIVSLSAQLRGLGLVLLMGLFQQLDTAIVGVVGSLFSLGSAATQAAATVGGTFVAALAQAIPTITLFADAVNRLKLVMQAVQATQQIQQQMFSAPNQALINQLTTTNSLIQAEQSLANAYNQVRQAQEALLNSSLQITEARQALRRAESTGSQEGIAQARISLRQAQFSRTQQQFALRQAQQGVSMTQRQLQIAQLTAAEPQSQETGQQATLNYLLSQMSPVEKQLYVELDNVAKYFQNPNSPFNKIADYIVAPFVKGIHNVLGMLNDSTFLKPFDALGHALGSGIGKIFGTMTGKGGRSFIDQMAEDASKNIPIFINSIQQLMKIFTELAQAAAPVLHTFLTDFNEFVKALAARWSTPQGAEKLSEFFQHGAKYAQDFFHWAGALFNLLSALGGQAAPVGGNMLENWTTSLNNMANWVRSHGAEVQNFFKQAGGALQGLMTAVGAVGRGMVQLMDTGAFKNFAQLFSQVIVPVLKDAATAMGKFVDLFVGLMNSIPHAHALIDAFGGLAVAGVLIGKLYSPLRKVVGLMNDLRKGNFGKIFGGGGGLSTEGFQTAATTMQDAGEIMLTAAREMAASAGLKGGGVSGGASTAETTAQTAEGDATAATVAGATTAKTGTALASDAGKLGTALDKVAPVFDAFSKLAVPLVVAQSVITGITSGGSIGHRAGAIGNSLLMGLPYDFANSKVPWQSDLAVLQRQFSTEQFAVQSGNPNAPSWSATFHGITTELQNQLKQLGPQGRQQLTQAVLQWAQTLEQKNPNLRQPITDLINNINTDFGSLSTTVPNSIGVMSQKALEKLHKFNQDFQHQVRQMTKSFSQQLDSFSSQVAGGTLLSSTAKAPPATSVARQLMRYFRGEGLSRAGAAGIIGNFSQESSLNPTLSGASGLGLAQWIGGRRTNETAFATHLGLNPYSVQAEAEFTMHELLTMPGLLQALKTARNPAEAALIFEQQFERAGIPNNPARESYALGAFRNRAYASGGVIGRAPWGGRPVGVVAHEGERISNPGQWSHIAGLAGMSPSSLDRHMGYDSGSPRQFADGGMVTYTASQGAPRITSGVNTNLAQINSFLQNITTNLYNLDLGSVYGSLSTIGNLVNVLHSAFQRIGQLGSGSMRAQVGRLGTLIENFADPNNVNSTLNALSTAFQRYQNNLANWIVSRSYQSAVVGQENDPTGGFGTSRNLVSSSLLALAGGTLTSGNIGRTGTTLQDSLTSTSLLRQQQYLTGESAATTALITRVRGQIRAAQQAPRTRESQAALKKLESYYNELVQQQETLAQSINSIVTQRYQTEQQFIQDQLNQINDIYGTRQQGIQGRQAVAQTRGNYNASSGFDTQLAAAARAQIRSLQAPLQKAKQEHNADLVAQIEQQMAQLRQTAAEAAVTALQDSMTAINNAAQTKQAGIQTQQAIAQGRGDFAGAASFDQQLQQAALAQIAQLQPLLEKAQKEGDTGLAQQIQQQMDQLQQTAAQAAIQALQDAQQAIDQAAQTQQAGGTMLQSIAQTQQGAASTAAQFAAAGATNLAGLQANQSSYQTQLAGLNALLGQAQAAGDTATADQLLQEIDQVSAELASNTQAIKDNTVQTVQQTASYIQSRGQFATGVYSGIASIINTIGQTTGYTDIGALAGVTNQSNQALMGTNSSLLSQLAQLGGGASSIAASLAGVTDPGTFASILAHANISGAESGQDAQWIATFEGIIQSLESNTEAIATNNQQLAQLNGQLLQPQQWSTTAWTSFRTAIFSGMGNLLPQYQASLAGTGYQPTQAPIFNPVSSGNGKVIPAIGSLHVTHAPVPGFDPSLLGEQMNHEITKALA